MLQTSIIGKSNREGPIILPESGRDLSDQLGTVGHDDGFTLIELIIVCALIGVFLTLAVPSMRNAVFNDPLKMSTRKLVGFVSGLREVAVRNQVEYLLHISQIDNRIWYEEDSPKATEDNKSLEKSAEEQNSFEMAEDIRISEVWIGGKESSALNETVVWISNQGLMNHTKIQLQDDLGNDLTVDFFPFIETPQISDHFEVPEK
ncbi:MAG: prepilin-type N-terminal cleavage/methylation domain-containing protein [Desulfobulbaceae bacterium]|nr:prepilin-type N-terminal cleavage/methylation domain-containing protein [Desulfobulbaceae bacterium]